MDNKQLQLINTRTFMPLMSDSCSMISKLILLQYLTLTYNKNYIPLLVWKITNSVGRIQRRMSTLSTASIRYPRNLTSSYLQVLNFDIQSTRDITNFKGPRKKFVISKVRYIEIRYIKRIYQLNSL